MPANLEQRAAAFLALAEKATTDNLPNGERKPWFESIEDFYSLYLAARNDAPALVADLLAKNRRLQEERDLAVAHDSQPYPTAEAYEKVCALLEAAKVEVRRLRKARALLREEAKQ